jgi:preprotein translocase subunit SecG
MEFGSFAPFLSVVEIVLALVIIALVLLQVKGSDLGGFMGGDTSTGYRSKRGVELILHRVTIGFSVAFFVCTLLTFIALGEAS